MANMMVDKEFKLDHFNPPAVAGKIAGRMKDLRLAQNITQQNLALRSGVSLGSIKRFESKHEISLKNLLQIALTLDALEAFHELFPVNEYHTMNELLDSQKGLKRQRARNV